VPLVFRFCGGTTFGVDWFCEWYPADGELKVETGGGAGPEAAVFDATDDADGPDSQDNLGEEFSWKLCMFRYI
jgi:hypothetical protein